MLNPERLKKRLALALAYALAVIGGAVAMSAVNSTYVTACPNNNC